MNTTIPQRLREIAAHLVDLACGGPDDRASLLYAIAAELEAPDAVQAQENRHGLVALQCLREEVERAMAPVHAAFDERSKAEKPAADAVPVVAIAGLPDVTLIRQHDHIAAIASEREHASKLRETFLRMQHDHLAAVAALQARINALEARQPPSSAEDEFAVVWPDRGRFIANTLESARNYMSGAVPSCAERGVEPPVIVRYVPADTVPYEPQPDTSKEQP